MFAGAYLFNQPIDFGSTAITSIRGMFADARSFNSNVKLNTQQAIDMTAAFLRAESFNQPLAFDTFNVRFMTQMFEGANAFRQTLAALNAPNLIGCGSFCKYCGLPNFKCRPCGFAPKVTSVEGWQVCSCYIGQDPGLNAICEPVACLGRGVTGLAGFCECAGGFVGRVVYNGTKVTGCGQI